MPEIINYKNNIMKNCTYTVSKEAGASYPDNGKKLTDGLLSYSSNVWATVGGASMKDLWVGFSNLTEDGLTIEVDLGGSISKIREFEINTLYNNGSGIHLPSMYRVYISDGGAYSLAGTYIFPENANATMKLAAGLTLEEEVTASKIKFVLSFDQKGWFFVEEICAYTYEEETPDNSYYGHITIPPYNPSYWNSGDPDYNLMQNMALNQPYQIQVEAEIDPKHQTEYFNTRDNKTILTDGQYAATDLYTDPAWSHNAFGFVKDILITFENITGVRSAKIGFLRNESAGIYYPSWVKILISEDGQGWQTVYSGDDYNFNKPDKEIMRIEADFGLLYRAKYVMVKFRTNIHVYCDQIEIFGKKRVEGAYQIEPDATSGDTTGGFPQKKDFNGMSEVLLSYFGYTGTQKPITSDIFKPHVAYIEDGIAKDWMFDSFLFLPTASTGVKCTAGSWREYIDNEFIENGNINALETAVGELKTQMNQPDYKAGVIMAVFYPKPGADFGSIDGTPLDMNKYSDRLTALRWMIDEQIRRFNNSGYKHLDLKGFYWMEEGTNVDDSDDHNLIKFFNSYVRLKKYSSCWIPYFVSSGFELWNKLIFEIALMQPNYAFDLMVPKSRLNESIGISYKYGLGVELEVAALEPDYIDRLNEYYAVSAELGAMEGVVHMYYQSGVPGAVYNSYISTDPFYKSLYSNTYKFIKEKFSIDSAGPDRLSIKCSKNTPVNGAITGTPVSFVKMYEITHAPVHGVLKLDKSGSFVYTPDHDYTGTDTFKVRYNYGYMKSEPAEYMVTVG